MSLHSRIRQKLEEKKLRAADLARATKKSPVAVKKWLDGTSVPTAENLKVIAKFLGVSDDWLLYGGPVEQESNNLPQLNVINIEAFKQKYNIPDSEDAVKFVQTSDKPFPIQKRYVPVKAYSKMGMDGYFTDMGYDGNAGDGYVPTHTAGPRAYGIKGTGDSMFPAIRNGWYVVCDPDAELVPNEFVQVCLKDGRCTIKEFVGINGGVLSLLSVNGGERFFFEMDEVESITAITDIVPPSQHRQEHPYSH
ncbi:helix-turn-helix domain-containing protein [Acinetobacter baumannii]|nr:helix-turn-helix domain-containing protein [Acinetobacter baumannii]